MGLGVSFMNLKISVNREDCWLFAGYVHTQGYGRIYYMKDGKPTYDLAHRAVYSTFVGEIPEDYTIDHLCMVKSCVNPEHLETVTRSENSIRANIARDGLLKRLCTKGHERTKVTSKDGSSKWDCLECDGGYRKQYLKEYSKKNSHKWKEYNRTAYLRRKNANK